MRSTGYTAEDSSTGSRTSCLSPTPPRAARHCGCSGEEDPTWGRERIKNHWCWQVGPANDEHSGLVGGIGDAASSPRLSREAFTAGHLTPLIGDLGALHLYLFPPLPGGAAVAPIPQPGGTSRHLTRHKERVPISHQLP